MYKIINFLILNSVFFTACAHAENSRYIKLDTFIISESSALTDLNNHWQGSYQAGGNNQIASLWLEVGLRKDQWSFAGLYREEQRLHYLADTADFYNGIENARNLDVGRRYLIDLDSSRFQSIGVRAAYRLNLIDSLQLEIGASLFHASHLTHGGLKGFAQANTVNDYDYNADVDYTYYKDVLFDRPNVKSPNGLGVAIDLQAQWKINPAFTFNANIKDLAGLIRWKNAPYTKATVTSNVKTVGADGFIDVQPALAGFEGSHSKYTQKLKASSTFGLTYAPLNSKRSYLLKSRHYPHFSQVGLGVVTPFMNKQVGFTYWPETKSLETAFKIKKHALKIGLDNVNLSKVQTLWVSWDYDL